jgi:hypothetical protein
MTRSNSIHGPFFPPIARTRSNLTDDLSHFSEECQFYQCFRTVRGGILIVLEAGAHDSRRRQFTPTGEARQALATSQKSASPNGKNSLNSLGSFAAARGLDSACRCARRGVACGAKIAPLNVPRCQVVQSALDGCPKPGTGALRRRERGGGTAPEAAPEGTGPVDRAGS